VSQVSATKARILLTGAIGDYGTTVSYNKKGKVDSNGAIQKVKLTKGGFSIDATALDQKLNKIKPSFNSSNCSALFSGTGTGKLFGGSGAYKVIRGTLKITVTFAEVAPRYTSGAKQGQCNFADSARPMAQFNAITATGNVTY
jgi:hypothetical protein